MNRIAARALALAVALVAPWAAASESYTAALQDRFALSCPPPCTLCHTGPEGGLLTANTPFGIAARRARLPCCDAGALDETLTLLESNATDTDDDGVEDVAELRAGTDPNFPGQSLGCAPPAPEESGCQFGPHGAGSGAGLSVLFGAVGLALRRRRRRGFAPFSAPAASKRAWV